MKKTLTSFQRQCILSDIEILKLRHEAEEWVKKHDLSTLRILGSVTVLLYGKKIDANTEALNNIDTELGNIHKTVIEQSNWNTRVGTIIEIQTGIQVNP